MFSIDKGTYKRLRYALMMLQNLARLQSGTQKGTYASSAERPAGISIEADR